LIYHSVGVAHSFNRSGFCKRAILNKAALSGGEGTLLDECPYRFTNTATRWLYDGVPVPNKEFGEFGWDIADRLMRIDTHAS
jgi:hypothetical protein